MKSAASNDCPTVAALGAYSVGRLVADELEKIALHVETCPGCEETLVALAAQEDTLVSGLRYLAAVPDQPVDPVLAQAVERLLHPDAAPRRDAIESRRCTDEPGTKLRDYRVLEKLGQGGMGTVYRALHTKLDREVALKILPTRLPDNQSIARFTREMKAVGKLDHPNIVRAYDAGEVEGTHYLVMELVRGIDLGRLVKSNGPLPIPEACEIIRQAALGLQHAHEHGFVHRDIKPSNLMLSAGLGESPGAPDRHLWNDPPRIKILDLGLARMEQRPEADSGDLTDSGQLMGTADYMAPEQWLDTHRVDIRADIYALGCTLYYLIAGQPPFGQPQCDTVGKKMLAHAQTPVPPIQGMRPDVPNRLVSILDQMLAKDPSARFATPIDVAVALEPLAADADIGRLWTSMLQTVAAATERAESHSSANQVLSAGRETDTCEPNLDRSPPPHFVGRKSLSSGPGRKLLSLAAAVLLILMPLPFFFGAQVIRFVTNKGQVVIELDDPAIEVTVKEGGATLLDRQGSRTLTLAAGDHQLDFEIKYATGDVERFSTDKFTLARGGKEIVKVSRALAKADDRPRTANVPAATTTESARSDPPDSDANADRRAIEYLLSIGGQIGILVDDQYRGVRTIAELPEGPFRLTLANLRYNSNVTDDGLASFKNCKNLTYLDLYDTQVGDAGLAYFKDCKNLSHLNLYRTQVTDAGLAHFKDCKKLTYLELYDTRVTDAGMVHFRNCKDLTYLHLDNTQVTDAGLANFKDCDNLTHLFVGATGVTDAGLADFGDCSNLSVLDLYGQPVTDAGLAHFKDCKKLTVLELAETSLTDAGLAHFKDCTDLTNLNLGGTQVGDAGLAYFKNCKNLAGLNLNATRVTDTGLALLRDCKNLTSVSLGNTKISDAGLAHLSDCQNLKDLGLYGTQVTDAGLAHFIDCVNVVRLDLHATNVTDAGLAYFRNCRDLILLNLGDTQVTDAGLAQLKDCKNLAQLWLYRTRVTDVGLDALVAMPKLAELYLDNCRISRYGYEQLKAALPSCKIMWSEPNRAAAELVLGLGGTVQIGAPINDATQFVYTSEALPSTFFKVRRIVLKNVKKPLGDLPATLALLTFAETDRLEAIDLSGTPLTDYRFLAPIHGLRELTLAASDLSYDTLVTFPKLPQLRRLVLDDNIIGAPTLGFLHEQPELTDLSLNCPTITDFAIKRLAALKQLKHLSLVGTGLTDAGLATLQALSNLETLNVRNTKVTEQGVAVLQQALANCKIEWRENPVERHDGG
jgi:serine/threonine protein kinase/Leucine-rich repeat (LRR) protein